MHPSSRTRQLVFALLAELCFATVRGQNFTFEGSEVVAGGGIVRGDRFGGMVMLGGAWIGQASSERFRNEFGFGIVEPRVEVGRAPVLTVERNPGYLTLAWEDVEAEFDLEEALDLVHGPWAVVRAAPERVEGRWRLEVPISERRYYRLVARPPRLSAETTPTSVRLSWVSLDPSFVLQQTRFGVEDAVWVDRATAVRPVAGRWVVEVAADAELGFFRLRRR